jgi:hypothetical protein
VPGCYAPIKGQLYVAGGQDVNGNLITLNEAYSPKAKSWTTLAPMPVDTGYGSASVDAGSRLYCFGGGSIQSPSMTTCRFISRRRRIDLSFHPKSKGALLKALLGRGFCFARIFASRNQTKLMVGENVWSAAGLQEV